MCCFGLKLYVGVMLIDDYCVVYDVVCVVFGFVLVSDVFEFLLYWLYLLIGKVFFVCFLVDLLCFVVVGVCYCGDLFEVMYDVLYDVWVSYFGVVFEWDGGYLLFVECGGCMFVIG